MTSSRRRRSQSLPPALLAMEDGTVYRGFGFGADGASRRGEIVFNTAITGYQEVLTDPSYRGQIVTMTAPEIGNVGINPVDFESARPWCAGFVVRELSPVVSNWRASGVAARAAGRARRRRASPASTRARSRGASALSGAQRAVITRDGRRSRRPPSSARASTRRSKGATWSARSPPRRRYDVGRAGLARPRAPSSRRRRAARPSATTSSPTTSASSAASCAACVVAAAASRVVPAATPAQRRAGAEARRHLPLQRPRRSGGGRLRGRGGRASSCAVEAAGVRHLPRPPDPRPGAGRQDLQAQVRPPRRQPPGDGSRHAQGRDHLAEPRLRRRRRFAAAGKAVLSHVSLNDKTVEGMRHGELPVFSVQYHPEASPGPNDAALPVRPLHATLMEERRRR